MAVCDQCSAELPPENDFVTCSGCKNQLHYNCASVRETVWRKYSTQIKLSWQCNICKTKTNAADKNKITSGDNKTISTEFNEVDYLRELLRHKDLIISNQVDLISSLKNQIDLMKTSLSCGSSVVRGGTYGVSQKARSQKPDSAVPVRPTKPEVLVNGGLLGSRESAVDDRGISEELRGVGGVVSDGGTSISKYDLHDALTRSKLTEVINLTNDSQSSVEWKKVKYGKRGSQTVIGKKSDNDQGGLRAAESFSYWHVYRLHPSTSRDDVENYLKTEFPGICVENLVSSNPKQYSSFKLTVREDDEKRILNPELWPSGARINRFFLSRKKL